MRLRSHSSRATWGALITIWTIHKYLIPLRDLSTIHVHVGAHLLHVGMQGSTLYAWFMVNTNAGMEDRTFAIVGTGAEVPDDVGMDDFVATVIDSSNGPGPGGYGYVWHLFEVGGAAR